MFVITPEDREVFECILEDFRDSPIICSVMLKVIHALLKKTLIIKEDLPVALKEKLETQKYEEFSSDDFEELRKYWSFIANLAQSEEIL